LSFTLSDPERDEEATTSGQYFALENTQQTKIEHNALKFVTNFLKALEFT